ncbi:MAG: GntR family transcriptional regulator [Planctomycetes bacterium]|nr:GntR family transcriptional regulator [Planctomycetota bacterium]
MTTDDDFTDATGQKQAQIQANLRERIISGAINVRELMPRRVDLEREFAVSRVTIQRVFNQLAEDGFVHAHGRSGTRVADHPPHLSRFALVFPTTDLVSNRFWATLDQVARRISCPERTIVSFFDVNASQRAAQHRLEADLHARRLAGVIWANNPGAALVHSPLVQAYPVPAVAIMPISMARLPGVTVDNRAFMERAVDHLLALGRRRIAVLTVPGHEGAYAAELIAQRGGGFRPIWMQEIQPDQGSLARSLIHLMFNRDQLQRPDALIIADDNLVEDATGGLIAAGVRIPDELAIVAHCNFPWPTVSVVPTRRLGFDARALLERCFSILREGRKDMAPSAPVFIPPVFENELAVDVRA